MKTSTRVMIICATILLPVIIIIGKVAWKEHKANPPGTTSPATTGSRPLAPVAAARSTEIELSHEWSKEFPSSPTELLRGIALTPGVHYQVRANGEDRRVHDVPLIGDRNATNGFSFGSEPVSYVQWRITPGQRAQTMKFAATYYLVAQR